MSVQFNPFSLEYREIHWNLEKIGLRELIEGIQTTQSIW
jgi:hypothetical protein